MPRYAKKGTTKKDIYAQMYNKLKKTDNFDEEDFDENDVDTFAEAFFDCVAYGDNSPILKDLSKINFDWENSGVCEENEDVNFKNKTSLSDGTEFIWCFAGGDWECPVFFVLYIDDKNKLRGYIPSDGNIYCHTCKCAYGSCECDDQTENDKMIDEQPDPDWSAMYADVCNRIQTK